MDADRFDDFESKVETVNFIALALIKYIKAKACWRNPHYFIEFLFKCSVKYPVV